MPLNKDVCFFCQKSGLRRNPLHKASTKRAGEHLRSAVELSNDDSLKVRLNTAIDPTDAHAIDVQYHNNCWNKYVCNVLRKANASGPSKSDAETEIASEIEFLSLLDSLLADGNILSMSSLQATCHNIRAANGVKSPRVERKKLKLLIQEEISDVEFSNPLRKNESERVSLKQTKDKALSNVENSTPESEMQEMFNVARALPRDILQTEEWTFSGSLQEPQLAEKYISKPLYMFFRWLIQGPTETIANIEKQRIVDRQALTLVQSTMYSCLSARQVTHKPSTSIRHTREWPQQLAVGLTVHQSFRSEKIIEFLHGLGISVDYKRIIRLENQIANQVINLMRDNQGVYIPQDIVKDRFLFFAVDNCDFAEDTPDGKRTLHGTAIAMYQRCTEHDQHTKFHFESDIDAQQLQVLPAATTTMLSCHVPANVKPKNPVFPEYKLCSGMSLDPYTLKDIVWLYACSLAGKMTEQRGNEEIEADMTTEARIPTWSAYNSLISDAIPLTRTGTPPLIPAPAHEWSTLLTVLKQTQCINTVVVGPNRKTVITLDMGLYKPAKQLEMYREDLQ